jgi:hypothetical protein
MTLAFVALALPVVIAIYYLAWKYGVAFFIIVAGLKAR